MTTKPIIKLSPQAEEKIENIKRRYPSVRSAVMPALYIAQEECGHLSEDAIRWVSTKLEMPESHVFEVATFYTMYYKHPVGKYHVQVCRTLSCMLCGARDVTAHLKKRLGLAPGEISKNGLWSYEEVECLGSCGTAPMVQINDVFFEKLTIQKLDHIMDRIEREQPDLRYSTVREELGGGLADHPRSEVF